MSSEADIRALAQRFFDAIEAGDVDTVADCYAPNAVIWHNNDGLEQSRDENITTLKGFVRWISPRTYTERRVRVFDDGFMQQHELRGVRPDGVAVRLPACIVCAVEGGKIVRLDEYLDSAHVAEFSKDTRPR